MLRVSNDPPNDYSVYFFESAVAPRICLSVLIDGCANSDLPCPLAHRPIFQTSTEMQPKSSLLANSWSLPKVAQFFAVEPFSKLTSNHNAKPPPAPNPRPCSWSTCTKLLLLPVHENVRNAGSNVKQKVFPSPNQPPFLSHCASTKTPNTISDQLPHTRRTTKREQNSGSK